MSVSDQDLEKIRAALQAQGQIPRDDLEGGRQPQNIQAPSGEAVIASTVIPQLASDSNTLQRGQIDQRKLSVITEYEQMALAHFNYRGEVDHIRYYANMVDWILNTSPSVGGLGRRQLIQAQAAVTGGQGALEVAKEPGFVGRHFTNRDWRNKAEAQGKIVRD